MSTESRDNDRWMLLAGPLFTVLAIASLSLGATPSETTSAAEVVEKVKDDETSIVVSGFIAGPAAAVLLVFVSRLRAGIDDRARAARSLLVAGGTVVAAGLAVAGSVLLALTTAADKGFEGAAQSLNVLNASMWIPVVIGIAAMLFGAGLAVLRTGILPAWLGWVAAVVGVVSVLGPGGFLGFFVMPLWVGLAGILLYLRTPAEVTAPV